jgi:hypothetical protein
MEVAEDLNNFCELNVEGVFIKHDFEHIIVKPDEVSKYTNGDLSLSTLKQCLYVPYEFDIQVLVYFLHAHFPSVETVLGMDEIEASSGNTSKQAKNYDLKVVLGNSVAEGGATGVVLKYFYTA